MASSTIDFVVGSRRLLSVPRELVTIGFSLEDALHGRFPPVLANDAKCDGFRVLSCPQTAVNQLLARHPDHAIGGRQDYPRHYIDMAGDFESYMDRFSGKTRSTLRRKQRKLAKECRDELRLTEHRSRSEVEEFFRAALPLSQQTYQSRLLDAGLPEQGEAQEDLLVKAARDQLRCFLLWSGDEPIAYLALPIAGGTVVYAWLGYHPDWARFSPGTVLQMEALERLFAEGRFRYFDFTEGDGAHKALFGTDSVECSSFVMLKSTLANRALLATRDGFDTAVAGAKALADRGGALSKVRSLLKA